MQSIDLISGHNVKKVRGITNSKYMCEVCGMESGSKKDLVDSTCEDHLEENDGRTFKGQPVRKNEEQLAYLSSKSDTIHLVDVEEGTGSYNWSECGMGGRKSEEMYIHKSEFGNDYIIRNGEVVGKLCGKCSKAVPEEDPHAQDD